MASRETETSHRPKVMNGKSNEPRDDLMRKFSKNMRKVMATRDFPKDSLPSKAVKFNTETIETSFGGTQTPGKIKELSMIETVSGDCDVTDKMFTTSSINPSVKKPLFAMETKLSACPEVTPVISVNNDTPLKPPKHNSCLRPASASNTPQNKLTAPPAKLDHAVLHKTPSPFMMKNRRYTLDNDTQGTPDYYNPVAFETPATGKSKHRWSSGDAHGAVEGLVEDSVSMTVAVRVRPFTQREEEEEKCVVSMVDNETVVNTEKGERLRFTYDYSFWSFDDTVGDLASQEEVYMRLARPMLGKAFEGYNTCLFAYGQTGSGKSYSIMGNETSPEHIGIIPRFCDEFFEQVEAMSARDKNTTFNVEISYFEIYNEKIHDLLCPSTKIKAGKKPNLKVREHPVLGPYVEGLSSYVVKTFDDVKSWLNVGNKHRATAATGMNDKSSRSHSVFTTLLTQTKSDTIEGEVHEHSVTSKINIVDLAGSERQTLAKTSGDRLREGASINKSLHTLGKVISVLSEQGSKKKKLFVPYRDSVLTCYGAFVSEVHKDSIVTRNPIDPRVHKELRILSYYLMPISSVLNGSIVRSQLHVYKGLLKESVGGNSKTAMLATISPALRHVEETLSTLRYARQASNIINKVRVNEDPKAKLIRELKAEIEHMRQAMGTDGMDNMASWAEVTALREQLAQREQEMKEMSKSWRERLEKSEEKKQEEARLLERSGVAFKVDSSLPNLVNLNEDPQLSEVLLYVLREGKTHVGRQQDDSDAEIQLVSPLIADHHCVIVNEEKTVHVTPIGDAPTFVNGDLITGTTQLHHGDRVILGGDHYFRLNYPGELQDKRSSGQFPAQPRDFEYAKQELTRVQNERLEQELEEARRKHEEMMAAELLRQQSKAQDELDQLKEQADQRLIQQRSQYEDRLQELAKLLEDQHARVQLSDENQQQATDVIRKLEQEKTILEQEVSMNRKRRELEAKAAQQAVLESKATHSQLVEQLQLAKDKLGSEMQRYESKKQERAKQRAAEEAKAKAKVKEKVNGKVAGPNSNLYRTYMRLREANKISQLLKKDTTFTREDKPLSEGCDPVALVKVTNKKLRISTYWTMDKFEDKWMRMKEIYEGEMEAGEEDDTFYDPSDAWEKEDRLACSPSLSPKIITSLRRQCEPAARSPLSSSPNSPRSPIFALTAGNSITNNKTSTNAEHTVTQSAMTQQLLGFYRDVITSNMNQFNDSSWRTSCADRVLQHSETIKTAVTSMLQSYNKSAENKLSSKTAFYEHPDLLTCIHQVERGLTGLQTSSATWRGQAKDLSSRLIEDLFDSILASVKKLANHVVLFLQGCESDIDSMIQEASCQVFSTLFTLCQSSGELALASDVTMTSLRRHHDESAHDVTYGRVGVDVREHFLKGCDAFIDKTLHGGVRSIEECELKVMAHEDDAENLKESTYNIVKQVEMTVASCKVLLERLQVVQVELDSTLSIRDSLQPSRLSTLERAPDYYVRSYRRCQALIGHISNMADGVSLLTQVTEQVVRGTEATGLRRLHRCTEMIQKATTKMLSTSASDSLLGDIQSDSSNSETSVLTDLQNDQIAGVGQEVEFAANTLSVLIKRELEVDQLNSPAKSKRALPMSPSSGTHRDYRKHAQNARRNLADFDR